MVFDILHFAIILFLVGGAAFALGPLVMGLLLPPRAKGGDMDMPYECGMEPHGSAWTNYGISYYMYALIFIAFDVDVLYLFPVSIQYHLTEGWGAFAKLCVFLFFLFLALIYFRAKGVFTWQRKIAP
ncbi:MAG: NADH-quinone oxidoreductase subunit A [Deltaproteobacteria bacterium]|nr:NADH-quinone oxidoreductase subunit A [Deltaproteobacteria bacterium]